MTLTATEKKERHEATRALLKRNDLRALLFIGDTNVGHSPYGDFRYYTKNHVFFQRQVALAFPDSEPVLVAYSEFSGRLALERSFIEDVRISRSYPAYHGINQMDPLIYDVVTLLRERGISEGRIGVSFDMLPVSWHTYLRRELPRVEWVEVHEDLMKIRFRRSREEAGIFRKGAALGDAGFEAALKVIRPGATEHEIVAAIEYAARKEGAEEHFTLIGSGRFAFGDPKGLPLPVPPSGRRIERGDSIFLEITPRYEGYWTQLVRIVTVGQPNDELEKMQRACRDAIEKGLEQFKPGKRVMDVATAMQAHVGSCGFVGKPPFGHICAIDLVEDRVTPDNERLLEPGLAMILHPMAHTADGKNVIFWGQTYLATPEGYERLHHAPDEILTL